MGAWRVELHYGVGAANVRLCPEPYLHPDRSWGLLEGIARLREDIHAEGRSWARSLAIMPIGLLALVIVTATVMTAVRGHVDRSGVEIVMLKTEPMLAQIEVEAIPEPEPVPVPVVRPEPKPLPKPEQKIAKLEPPKPPPLVQRPKPKPIPPPRAEVSKPRPPPPPKPRPVVQIDAVAKVAPAPPPTAYERTSRSAERQRRVVAPVVAPMAKLDSPSASPPPQSRRFATVRPQAGARSMAPQLEPMIASSPAPPASASSVPTRPGVRADRPRPRGRTLPAAVDSSALGRIDIPRESAPSGSTRRADRPLRPDARDTGRRNTVQLAALAAPSSLPNSAARASLDSRGPRRSAVAAPSASRRSADGRELRGVPLGSLASCMTDREEDGLKQRIVAAVTTQKTCVSRAGAYQFVETKNLNSFLMWVDPVSGRRSENRCDELRLALACLEKDTR